MAKANKHVRKSDLPVGQNRALTVKPSASHDLKQVAAVLEWATHRKESTDGTVVDYLLAERELKLDRKVIKAIIMSFKVASQSVDATDDGVKFKGSGAATIRERAKRRGEIFALLHERQLERESRDQTQSCEISAQDVVNAGLSVRRTAEADLDAIYDFAHSMRLTEEGLKAGKYAFSTYLAREARNSELKDDIAAEVAKLVSPGVSCACTEGSTPARCIRAILERHQHVSIVTNNLLIFQGDAIEHTDIFVCGGDYHADSHAMTGSRAVRDFTRRPCELTIAGAYSIDSNGRVYVYHHADCAVQWAAVSAAKKRVIIACDRTKLAIPGRWSYLDLYDYSEKHPSIEVVLATNKPAANTPAAHLLKELREGKNIRVIHR